MHSDCGLLVAVSTTTNRSRLNVSKYLIVTMWPRSYCAILINIQQIVDSPRAATWWWHCYAIAISRLGGYAMLSPMIRRRKTCRHLLKTQDKACAYRHGGHRSQNRACAYHECVYRHGGHCSQNRGSDLHISNDTKTKLSCDCQFPTNVVPNLTHLREFLLATIWKCVVWLRNNQTFVGCCVHTLPVVMWIWLHWHMLSCHGCIGICCHILSYN